MKTRFLLLATLILINYTPPLNAQSLKRSYDERLFISFKSGEMKDWVAVIDELEADYRRTKNSETLYEITHAQYGYIGFLIGSKNIKFARQYLVEAEKNIEILINEQPKNASSKALKGALLAYQISMSPYKAPFIGPKSMAIIDESLKLDSNSVQALIERGNAAHYAPSLFGGDPIEAVKYYSKALSILEKQNGKLPPNTWIYLNTYTQLALAFEKAKQYRNAKQTYNHILTIAPDFKWVANELYPQFKKRHST